MRTLGRLEKDPVAETMAIGGPVAVHIITKGQFESLLGKTSPFVNKLVSILTSNARTYSKHI